MDTIIVKDDNNKYYVAAFLLFIIIVIIIVVIILFIVPKSTVALFGACTDQSECSSGLICTKNTGGTGGVCLGGLNYQCNNNSDCSKNYICLDNSFSNTKVCMFQPQITTNLSSSTFQTSPITGGITTAPVINLTMPQNISFATTPCNVPYNTVNYNPQALLNSILPAPCPSNYGGSAGFGGAREFRSFAPMGITTGKKKL